RPRAFAPAKASGPPWRPPSSVSVLSTRGAPRARGRRAQRVSGKTVGVKARCAVRVSLHEQLRAPFLPAGRAGICHERAAARDALARRGRRAALDPVDEQLERSVGVRLDELELLEVAAALAVPLDVVAVLDLVVAVEPCPPGGHHGVAE